MSSVYPRGVKDKTVIPTQDVYVHTAHAGMYTGGVNSSTLGIHISYLIHSPVWAKMYFYLPFSSHNSNRSTWREDMWNRWLVKAAIPDAWPHPATPSSRRRARGEVEARCWKSLCQLGRHNYMSLMFNLQMISDPEPGCCPTSYHDKIWVRTILPVLLRWEGSSHMEAGRELCYVVMGQDLPVYCWEHQTSEQEACRQVRAWSMQHG